ncbi:MAG: hypothetical protein K6G45_06780 [Lachnospiraceae bacterium]|nr:hypothetical protein [Lachnospiraceae bacterium]MCR5768176.1 hypothetical protein [Lachnospiraceae bacterium]
MSITPLEMYTMIPKSQEAVNVRHGEQVRENAQQAGMMQQAEAKSDADSMRTVAATETENPDYRYDAKDGGNGQYADGRDKNGHKDKKEHSEKEKGIVNMTDHPGGIDFRI